MWVIDSTAVPNNAPGGFPSVPTDTVPINHGYNFFAGGDQSDTVTPQFIDISPASAAIDAGSLPFTLSADLGGYGSQEDRGEAPGKPKLESLDFWSGFTQHW